MTRRSFIGGAAAMAAAGCINNNLDINNTSKSAALEATKKWFKEAQFGMMAHWGLYSLLGGEWNGKSVRRAYSEWAQWSEKIPMKEYAALAKAFNPIFFNPKEWMKRARDAGMKYFVFTSKHHDGFAMFRSRVSNYNVVDATPFKRDVVEEIAEACRDTGIKLGLYYSQDVDWSERDGGGKKHPEGLKIWGNEDWRNTWDWPADREYDFSRYFEGKCKGQVKEILTQYGDLCLIWFDVPSTILPEQCKQLKAMVRKYQPGCLINGRLGYGLGDYTTPYDNEIAVSTDSNKLYETVGTMNDSWGYRPTDVSYKSVETIREIKAKCASIGSNYMLNIGPDHLGRIPSKGISILEGLAKKTMEG